jgi:hypothetical protein
MQPYLKLAALLLSCTSSVYASALRGSIGTQDGVLTPECEIPCFVHATQEIANGAPPQVVFSDLFKCTAKCIKSPKEAEEEPSLDIVAKSIPETVSQDGALTPECEIPCFVHATQEIANGAPPQVVFSDLFKCTAKCIKSPKEAGEEPSLDVVAKSPAS